MRGPIDYIIVDFPGNKFKGEILDELTAATDAGVVAVLDLSLISKDEEGRVTAIEMADKQAFHEILPQGPDARALIQPDDLSEVADLMANNSTAGLLIIEHLWARGLKSAIQDSDGILLAEGRIHPDAYSDLT